MRRETDSKEIEIENQRNGEKGRLVEIDTNKGMISKEVNGQGNCPKRHGHRTHRLTKETQHQTAPLKLACSRPGLLRLILLRGVYRRGPLKGSRVEMNSWWSGVGEWCCLNWAVYLLRLVGGGWTARYRR